MKTVLITGADGFLGCNIVSAFLQAGWFVQALDQEFRNPALMALAHERLTLIHSNCSDLPLLYPDALVHAAFVTATPAARGESPEANLRSNLEPLLALMEYAHRQSISRSVFLSSDAVFRSTPPTAIDAARAQQPLGVYGVAKTVIEQMVETMREIYGRDFVCARLGAVYGPFEFPRATRPQLSSVGQMVQMAMTQGEIAVRQPDEQREWTYAGDVGRALLALFEADSLNHALYQIASGERLTNLEIARRIADLFDGVSLRILADDEDDEDDKIKEEPLRRLGWLDNDRLRQGTGFADWTKMSANTLDAMLECHLKRVAHA